MKSIIHDIVIPTGDGTPDKVSVCCSEVDAYNRPGPYVRMVIKLKDDEKSAITALRARAKRILVKRAAAALALIAADPNATPSLDAPVADEDNA
ncbi:hypothetical protein UFOVP141_7 [uncultured Caudovirales phage]|uniref:Uncharacterized protein n=1 Tax=uncultured Caudovirales phage TaxID=2100421 RepID=A0A6J7VT30_9CAUD|nr:hypothetical protein UFOVP141_7 [uncultured Caudovirales phage]